MSNSGLWLLPAGVAIFIYAMTLLEESLRGMAGRSFKKYLQRQTSNRLKALLGGTVVTAFLQSSSVVLLMVLSFVGAGIVSMRNALAIVLGSNLGTTLDSWVVASLGFKVDMDVFAYPALAVSLIGLVLFNKHPVLKYATRFLIGFALLFIGLEWMKDAAGVYVENFDVTRFADYSPYLFIIVGFLLTSVIQSSSATIAITLTALHNDVIPFTSAAGIVIGSELGTTLKILIGSIGGIPDKKRVAWGNFVFNAFTLVLAAALLPWLVHLILNVIKIPDPLIALVTFQTGINVLAIALFYPFVGRFSNYLEKTFQSGAEQSETSNLKPAALHFPEDALELLQQEKKDFVERIAQLQMKAFGNIQSKTSDTKWYEKMKGILRSESFEEQYRKCKIAQGEMLEYLLKINTEDMSEEEKKSKDKMTNDITDAMHAAKSIKDIVHNLADMESSANDFIHNQYELLRDTSIAFAQTLLDTSASQITGEDVKDAAGTSATDVLQALSQNKISDYEASTILNVQRELNSARLALARAAGVKEETTN